MHFLEIVVCDCSMFCLCRHGVAFILWRLCFLIFPIQAWSFTAQVCASGIHYKRIVWSEPQYALKAILATSFFNWTAGRFRYHLHEKPGLNCYRRKNPSVRPHCLGNRPSIEAGAGHAAQRPLPERGRSPQPRPHRAHAGPAGVRLHPRGTSGGAFLGSVEQLPSGPPCCHYLVLEKRGCFFHNVTCI